MSKDQTPEEDTEPQAAEPAAEQEQPDTGEDLKAQYDALMAKYWALGGESADKWRAMSRKHEAAAKELRQQQMSDSEKAISEAEERGRQAALAEASTQIARARLEAALTGVVPDDRIPDIIADTNIANYVTESGEIDADRIAGFRKRYSELIPKAAEPVPDMGHGVRDQTVKPSQLSRADLAGMSDSEILSAQKDGRLEDLLSGRL